MCAEILRWPGKSQSTESDYITNIVQRDTDQVSEGFQKRLCFLPYLDDTFWGNVLQLNLSLNRIN